MNANVSPGSQSLIKMALIVEYDGTNYQGFQWQPEAPTIQGELEKAIYKVTQEKVRVLAASRTDTGVHAKGQVVSFRTTSSLPTDIMIRALNYYLPKDILVKKALKVELDFNVQRDAASREYCYYILDSAEGSALWRNYVYHSPFPLDFNAMGQACALLVGCHNFAGFASKLGKLQRNTIRTIYEARVQRKGPFIVFYIRGNSFLPHQIRHIVGALIQVGMGKMGIKAFSQFLENPQRGAVRSSIPAHGLYLVTVNYDTHPEISI